MSHIDSFGPEAVEIAPGLTIGAGHPLVLIAGPCVVESEGLLFEVADRLSTLAARLDVPIVLKASYEKDNRSAPEAFRGPGLDAGLAALQSAGRRSGLPLTTDVHRVEDIGAVAEVVDLLQIPALLCRQTSLLEAAGRSGRVVNVKKGQWLTPPGMAGAVAKLRGVGARGVLLTERGSAYGERLVCDPTAIPALARHGCPVVFDAGHGANARTEIGTLARAAIAAGADALFVECHPRPAEALCDGGRMLSLDELERDLPGLLRLAELVRAEAGWR